MTDISHLEALKSRLASETARRAVARSEKEASLRTVWIAQINREIADEYEFLGLGRECANDLTDDELLTELLA